MSLLTLSRSTSESVWVGVQEVGQIEELVGAIQTRIFKEFSGLQWLDELRAVSISTKPMAGEGAAAGKRA